MLQRKTYSNGIVVYHSPLLAAADVRHVFSTRLGGISPVPFDSMNLGNPSGCPIQDDYERIWENYRLLQETAGLPHRDKPHRVHQVHGRVVLRARAGEPFDCSAKADAIVSDDPTSVLSVRVADCVPILLATEDGRAVAAVHAGWRGVVAGVVTAALSEMSNAPQRCIAAIGPCIDMEAFEVGHEVLAEFERCFGKQAVCRRRDDGKGRVDLREAVRLQLVAAGVRADQIDSTDACTFSNADEFFSHRRENGATGRMAALIVPRRQ
jgi:hypothetical protein